VTEALKNSEWLRMELVDKRVATGLWKWQVLNEAKWWPYITGQNGTSIGGKKTANMELNTMKLGVTKHET
jgi:hypothetical protein